MPIQDVKACLEKTFTDESFAKKVAQIQTQEEFFSLAKDAGYDFTWEEWEQVRDDVENRARAYAEEHNIQLPDELSDEQLQAFAGGASLQRNWFRLQFAALGGALGALAVGAAATGPTFGAGTAVGVIIGAVTGAVGGAQAGDYIMDAIGIK